MYLKKVFDIDPLHIPLSWTQVCPSPTWTDRLELSWGVFSTARFLNSTLYFSRIVVYVGRRGDLPRNLIYFHREEIIITKFKTNKNGSKKGKLLKYFSYSNNFYYMFHVKHYSGYRHIFIYYIQISLTILLFLIVNCLRLAQNNSHWDFS